MPLIARGRTADIVLTLEPCQPQTTTEGKSSTVFVANVGVHRFGDKNTTHLFHTPSIATPCVPHQTTISTCSETVFADNLGVARRNDLYTGGEGVRTVTQTTVFADGP